MGGVAPILLLGLAGLLVGGAISMRRQGAGPAVWGGLGLLGAIAATAGLFWLWGG